MLLFELVLFIGSVPSGRALERSGLVVDLAQSGSQLSGSWQISFSSQSNSGSLQGVVSGNSVSARLLPSRVGACPYTLTATRSGNTLSGNYSAFNCTAALSGTLTGTKQ